MIDYTKFTLSNGLKLIVHKDTSTPLAAVNILYDVGAKDENPNRTGFAHLFEHLMFGGSVNIPDYDGPLQLAGGENNAFTSNDITNYYCTLPAQNLSTAFWLESDRMLSLAFSDKSLEVQRNVVIEEFKQRYFNQPYGDVWLLLRPLAYKVHPYQWATIGKEIAHIADASMQEVKDFFFSHYSPDNAIMAVAGNVEPGRVKEMAEEWFGGIKRTTPYKRNLAAEPEQKEKRVLEVQRDIPFDAIYKAYHTCARGDKEYYAVDLLSDILSRGKSSRLYNELVKKRRLFMEVHAYLTGDMDKGLVVLEGKLVKGVKMAEAEAALDEEVKKLQAEAVADNELTKVKNKIESGHEFGEVDLAGRALSLCVADLMGDTELVNTEVSLYKAVTAEQIMEQAKKIFREENSSVLYYLAKNN